MSIKYIQNGKALESVESQLIQLAKSGKKQISLDELQRIIHQEKVTPRPITGKEIAEIVGEFARKSPNATEEFTKAVYSFKPATHLHIFRFFLQCIKNWVKKKPSTQFEEKVIELMNNDINDSFNQEKTPFI